MGATNLPKNHSQNICDYTKKQLHKNKQVSLENVTLFTNYIII